MQTSVVQISSFMMQALAQKEEGNLVPTQFGPILAALRALLWVTEELHRCQASFKAACFGSVSLPSCLYIVVTNGYDQSLFVSLAVIVSSS